jgi:hypothetical protein
VAARTVEREPETHPQPAKDHFLFLDASTSAPPAGGGAAGGAGGSGGAGGGVAAALALWLLLGLTGVTVLSPSTRRRCPRSRVDEIPSRPG